MLFEDIGLDAAPEEAVTVESASRLTLLEAYWLDLLSNRQEIPQPSTPKLIDAETRAASPVADRQFADVL